MPQIESLPDYITLETAQEVGAEIGIYDPSRPYNLTNNLYRVIPQSYVYHHSSRRNGYLPKGKYVKFPYNGRWGNGFVIATYYSYSKVGLLYYLEV